MHILFRPGFMVQVRAGVRVGCRHIAGRSRFGVGG